MGKEQNQFRQGDILLLREALPSGYSSIEGEGRSIVLAKGEATGHAHEVIGPSLRLVSIASDSGVRRYLVVSQRGELVHPEHGAIRLRRGAYRVVRQKQFTDFGERQLED